MNNKKPVLFLAVFLIAVLGCNSGSGSSSVEEDLCGKIQELCTGEDADYYDECIERVEICEEHGLTEQKWDMDAVDACNASQTDCDDLVDCYYEAQYCNNIECDSVYIEPADCPSGMALVDPFGDDFSANDYFPCHSGIFWWSSGDDGSFSIDLCYLGECLTKEEILDVMCE